MRKPWNVGIVGCGRIAGFFDTPRSAGPVQTHAQAYHRHRRFQVVAAVDPIPERRCLFEKTWHVPHSYPSLDEMLGRERLDVVSICSPSEIHYSQAECVLTAAAPPRVLFIEKPVCLFPDQCAHLVQLGKRTGVGVLVNHTRRFDPEYRRVVDEIRSGTLGKFLEGRCTYYGGWMNSGTHLVDTVRMFLRGEPRVMRAAVSAGGRSQDDNLDVLMRVDGAEVRVEGFDEKYYQLFDLDFRFEAGRLRVLDGGAAIVAERVEVNRLAERVLTPLEGFPREGLGAPLAGAVEAIAAYLDGSDTFGELGVDLRGAAMTMTVLWRALELAPNAGWSRREAQDASHR